MPPLFLSPEEADQFPLEVSWSSPEPAGTGQLVAAEGELWLESSRTWPILQIPGVVSDAVHIRGTSGGEPLYLGGTPHVRGGAIMLRVNDLRLGSDDPDASIVAAWPEYDYADDVVTSHPNDGALRSPSDPLELPALDAAPGMTLTYAPGQLEVRLDSGAAIDAFETQLDGLQRLLTFSAQHAVVRRRLRVEDQDGRSIKVYRGNAVMPRPLRSVDYRDFPLRLTNVGTQLAIERWWAALNKLRPIPHLLAALRYKPGYLESDFLLLATSVDRLSAAWTSEAGPLTELQVASLEAAAAGLAITQFRFDNRPVFMTRASALASVLSAGVWAALHVDRDAWLNSLRRQRNLVAHADVQRPVHRKSYRTRAAGSARRDRRSGHVDRCAAFGC